MQTIGLRRGSNLAAFAIVEPMPMRQAMLHFIKADTRNYPGAYEALMQYTARELLAAGYDTLNYQEDLGIPSLRASKLSYRPCGFLRKYTVTEA